MASSHRVPEAFVWWLWEHARAGRHLTAADGRDVGVIYPGRRWGSWGPDFRGAVVTFDGKVARGDVEVHVRARDWFTHGHATDPEYGSTVLHVVFDDRGVFPDAVPPAVALAPHLTEPLPLLLAQWEQGNAGPTGSACLPPGAGEMLLRRAGLARLHSKADRFEGDLTAVSADDALLAGVIEGLGYASNVAPMRRLLERVSLPLLIDCFRLEGPVTATAQLFGAAGLLPSQRGRLPLDDYTVEIERYWRHRAAPGWPNLGWRSRGARPANSPVRRVAAAAALLVDADQLSQQILPALLELPPSRAAPALRRLLLRRGDAYWRGHGDFGRPLRAPSAVLGPQRAADLVVNVVLPWTVAVARRTGNEILEAAAIAAYEAHPGLGTNQITRHMARQVLGDAAHLVTRRACLQQGLIQLYRGWCDTRDCPTCPTHQLASQALSPDLLYA